MKRLLIFGFLAGLLGLSMGSNRAYSQLIPAPSDSLTAQTATNAVDDEAPIPVPSPELAPLPAQSQPEIVPPSSGYPTPAHSANAKLPPYYGSTVVPGINYGATAWQPGGYSARRGRPYYYTTPGRTRPLYSVHEMSGTAWGIDHSVYRYHFGPGHYRRSEGGHYRFPYYTYRAPWYFPGHPIYNRDTNRPW